VKSDQEIDEGDDRPQPIDGTFFRAIFAEYFDFTLDSVATINAVSMPDMDHDGGGNALKIKLLKARAFHNRLQACEASAKLTTQLFTALGTALRKASTRLEAHVKQFQILSGALAETDTFFELHGPKRSRISIDAYRNVENQASSTQVKLRKRLAEIQSAEAAAKDMVSRLRSLLSTVHSFRQTTSASIKQVEQEAKSLRTETKSNILKIAQRLEEEKKLADDLDSLLSADE